ncbi:MAG: TadE/TadG family type IV pilus assembly protein [Stenotrophobium sp.]
MNRQEAAKTSIAMRARQTGAAAMEFALVFPLLLLLTYGVIVYSYVYVLQSSINYAAQEGARAAVGVDPTVADGTAQAGIAVTNSLSWLPTSQKSLLTTTTTACTGTGGDSLCPSGATGVVVRVTFGPVSSLFPTISLGGLMGINAVPPLPAQLTAVAVVRT